METNTKSLFLLVAIALLISGCIKEPPVFVDDVSQPDMQSDEGILDMDTADTSAPPDVDKSAPTVVEFKPNNEVEGVELDAEISAVFSKAMAPETMIAPNIKLADKRGELVSELTYNEDEYRLSIGVSLALLTSYTATLESLTDTDNQLLEEFESTFQTRDGKWSSVQAVEQSSQSAYSPLIVVNKKGDKVAFWGTFKPDRTRYDAFINRFDSKTKQWGTPESVANSSEFIFDVSGSLDDDGNITVSWRHTTHIQRPAEFSTRFYDNKTLTWDAPQTHEIGYRIKVLNETLDELTLIWSTLGKINIKTFDKAARTWSSLVELVDGGTHRFATDAAGNHFLLSVHRNADDFDVIATTFYNNERDEWGARQTRSTANRTASMPSICSSPDGRFIALWAEKITDQDQWLIEVSEYTPENNQWSTPFPLHKTNDAVSQTGCAIDQDNKHITWRTGKIIELRRHDRKLDDWIAYNSVNQTQAATFRQTFDASGNGVLFWHADESLFAQRFDSTTNTWKNSEKIATGTIENVYAAQHKLGEISVIWSEKDAANIWNVRAKTFE